MNEPAYKGVPFSRLRIEVIYWSEERAEHIRTRGSRTGSGDVGIPPEWATEAALDPGRIVRLAGANNPATQSLKVVGWSPSANWLLKVWIWSDDPATSVVWNGGSAARANESDEKRYWSGAGGEGHE